MYSTYRVFGKTVSNSAVTTSSNELPGTGQPTAIGQEVYTYYICHYISISILCVFIYDGSIYLLRMFIYSLFLCFLTRGFCCDVV